MKMEYSAKNIQSVCEIIRSYREIYEDMKEEAYKVGMTLIRERDLSNPITRGELAKATGLPNRMWRIDRWGGACNFAFAHQMVMADFVPRPTYIRKPVRHYAEVDSDGSLVPGGSTFTLTARCAALYNGSK